MMTCRISSDQKIVEKWLFRVVVESLSPISLDASAPYFGASFGGRRVTQRMLDQLGSEFIAASSPAVNNVP